MTIDHIRGDDHYQSRFDWVVLGKQRGPLNVFDEPLFASSHGVVVPSLGSLVRGWTLIIPRRASPNFAALDASTRNSLEVLRQQTANRLRVFDNPVFEFEHGAANFHSVVGCGVDQAHVHMVPLRFDLIEASQSIGGEVIEFSGASLDPWRLAPQGRDYFLIRDTAQGHGVVIIPSALESQAIRKIIADHVGFPDDWDYRCASGLENAVATQSAFAAQKAREIASVDG